MQHDDDLVDMEQAKLAANQLKDAALVAAECNTFMAMQYSAVCLQLGIGMHKKD
jgi:hypothetical protein